LNKPKVSLRIGQWWGKEINMNKPEKSLRIKFATDYADKTAFAANARLLQSIWREENGIPLKRNYGNFLDENQAYQHEFNFLSDYIRKVVANEMLINETRKGADKKVIKKDRMYENLLASQPLAFNLFAELITPDYDLATKVFSSLFPEIIDRITLIDFEISPGRRDQKYTGDRSAFDVYVEYESVNSKKGFIGIEVKYSESLLDDPAVMKERYKDVARLSDKFTDEGIEFLSKMPRSLEQIWRDHLLALSMKTPVNNDFQEGFFMYLFPKLNVECEYALSNYFELLKSPHSIENDLHILHMETLIEQLKVQSNENWIKDFEDRYLNFEKINNLV
jgi:hypothetical protein